MQMQSNLLIHNIALWCILLYIYMTNTNYRNRSNAKDEWNVIIVIIAVIFCHFFSNRSTP